MAVYRRSTRTRYVLAVLVLAALTLVTVDARGNGTGVTSEIRDKAHDAFSPLQRATHAALQPVGNFLTGAADYGSLRQENQRLRSQVIGLQNQAPQAAAEKAAADQVLREQGLPWIGAIPTRTVEIIDNGSSNFENTLTVDKGTTSGLAKGQPVVAAGGLVGTVASVGSHTAVVTLLTDPTFAVGVRLDPANVGAAQGYGRNEPMRVSIVTTSAAAPKLKKGQTLLTSGLDSEQFPPNIPVGKIIDASKNPGSVEPDITVQPTVDLNQLTYLQVLLWAPQ